MSIPDPTDLPVVTPLTADLVVGAVELEPTARGLQPHRLPARARRQADDPQLLMAEAQPAGVRLAVRTAATALAVRTVPTKRAYAGLPQQPDGTYDLVVEGAVVAQGVVPGGDVLRIDLGTGEARLERGGPGDVRFDGLAPGEKDVEVWLPHDEATLLVELRSDAPVAPVAPRGPRWVHHGSSISQGSNAGRPTGTWPVVAAREAGLDLLNLGFGGGMMLDPFTARAIRDQPADGGRPVALVSLEIGINLVNADLLRRRALGPAVHGFLDTVREGHPDVPLLVVTPLHCPSHEDTPGPTAVDPASFASGRPRFVPTGDRADVPAGRLTLRVVREVLERVVEQRRADDPHLHLVDGQALFGPADHEAHPLPDGLHPDPATHRLVGERFAARLTALAGPRP